MKTSNKFSIIFMVVVTVFGLAALVKAAATVVDLGTTEDFAVLAGSGITDGGGNTTVITGDVGLDPTGGASITGLSCSQVTGAGTIYDNDAGYTGGFDADTTCLVSDLGSVVTLQPAKDDLVAAYSAANGQTPDTLIDDGDIGGGETLTPGVYSEDSTPDSLAITGNLILDGQGDPDAVFIFQTDSTLITASASTITLTGEAQACNVFWQVGSSATLGTNSVFVGTIMAIASITDDGGSTVEGRLLADADDNTAGAVTLDDTTITVPTCVDAATLTVIKVVEDSSADSSDFSVHVQESSVDVTGSPQDGDGSGTVYSLSAGTYTVSEDTDDDYDVSFSGDCDAGGSITLSAGESATCTITNTGIDSGGSSSSGGSRRTLSSEATLRVIKRVVNGGVGTATSSDFTVFVREDGDNVSGSPEDGAASPGTRYTLDAGTYVVSETPSASYVRSFSGDCNANGVVTLSDGDDETCTITNTYASVIPTLPNTGFPQEEKNVLWGSVALAFAALAVFGVVTRLRRGFNH